MNEALLKAAAPGYDGVVQVLRDGGADPGAVIRRRHSDQNKRMSIQTPLLAATTCGNESVVNLLLDWNVDLEVKNGYSRSALSVAVVRVSSKRRRIKPQEDSRTAINLRDAA